MKALFTALKLLKPNILTEAVKMIKKKEKELIDETFDTYECQLKIAELSKEIAA